MGYNFFKRNNCCKTEIKKCDQNIREKHLRGPRGPQSVTGPTGATGVAGPRGERGPTDQLVKLDQLGHKEK